MIKIGDYNKLKINRLVDFGAYLDAGDGREILIPRKFIDADAQAGDEIEAFVYTDSEDRLIATTEHPFARVGEFAFLQVAEVNKFGAFLDWGLESKQLLVPYSQQRDPMRAGGIYLVYVYLDDTTKRVVASSKVDKYLGNVLPDYKRGQEVKALVYQHTPIGYKCIVDNLHYGMIYSNEVYQPIEIEEDVTAYVKQVREDGKIDLTLSGRASERTRDLGDVILEKLQAAGGSLPYGDKSSPESIELAFQCSKKDFKKAIGGLYKERKITISPTSISLGK